MVFWGRLSAPVYALEQTVEALQNVRFLHVVGRDETGKISDERWIEIGMDGYQVRYRQQNPPELVAQFPGHPSMVVEDANSVALYRADKKAVILYGKDHQCQWIGPLGEFFENLRQQGKIVKENDTYQGRPAHKVWWPAASAECYVDPETKLPIAIGNATLSYEEPPAGTFDIVVPDGYALFDKRPGAVATATPDWLQQEDKTQVDQKEAFRQGTQALIRGDYAEAAKHLEQANGCDSWASFWLGKAYYELGRYDLAIKNFDILLDMYKKVAQVTRSPSVNTRGSGLCPARDARQGHRRLPSVSAGDDPDPADSFGGILLRVRRQSADRLRQAQAQRPGDGGQDDQSPANHLRPELRL